MRAGDANRRLGVSAIFHSKCLSNDEARSASSRLVTADGWRGSAALSQRLSCVKIFVAQRPAYI